MLASALGGSALAADGTAAAARPNIVFVMADDMAWHVWSRFDERIDTPNLDALAAQGVVFERAFSLTPHCPASRATILTGLHESTHHYEFGQPPLPCSGLWMQNSYPLLLRSSGYASGFFGKNGSRIEAECLPVLFDRAVVVERPYQQELPDGTPIHATDRLTQEAVDWISGQDGATPFIATLWYNAPHVDPGDPRRFPAPERFWGHYDGITFDRFPTSDGALWSTFPDWLQNARQHLSFLAYWDDDFDLYYPRYLELVTALDQSIGTILGQLATTGMLDNTVVVVTSDNGYFLGERSFGSKNLSHEPSARVPLVITDFRLGAPAGRVRGELVANIDLPSTFLELGAVAIPDHYQGLSLVPLLGDGSPGKWRDALLLEHSYRPAGPEIPRHYTVRTEDWKLIRFRDHLEYAEMFHLAADPYEETNLAEDPAHADQRQALETLLDALLELYEGPLFEDGFESGDISAWSWSVPIP